MSEIFNLASMGVVIALMAGFLWGFKVGLFEALLRLLAVIGAGFMAMSCLGALGRLLGDVLPDVVNARRCSRQNLDLSLILDNLPFLPGIGGENALDWVPLLLSPNLVRAIDDF